jgi:ABC-type multidrug transport system ATPase subunit
VAAVRDVSFEARAGAITALIGPNGAGKTTLMLMLATLLRPDAGTIRIEGIDPVAEPRRVRPLIGWMPDALGSWSNLTVRSALELTHRMYGHDRAAARARAQELIALVRLEPLADRPTRVLSRGQKQKLSLARALANDPRVLLLDEPASGLDPGARVELRELLQRLAAEGRTILISSHVLSELDEVATAAVYLDNGSTASVAEVERARASSRLWRIKTLSLFEQGTPVQGPPVQGRPGQGEPGAIGEHGDVALARTLETIGVARERIALDHQGVTVSVVDERDAAAMLSALVGAGVAVTSFAPASGELERTLQGLVRGDAP